MSLSLPDANITKVIGLLQILHQHGGEYETVGLANAVRLDAESLLPITEAAEVLGLIIISSGKVKLTSEGKSVLTGSIRERREAVRSRLSTLAAFKKVLDLLQKQKGAGVSKKVVHKMLSAELPKRQADATLKSVIAWGRHASLVGYNSDNDELFLVESSD